VASETTTGERLGLYRDKAEMPLPGSVMQQEDLRGEHEEIAGDYLYQNSANDPKIAKR
jgi:hypothetical protein